MNLFKNKKGNNNNLHEYSEDLKIVRNFCIITTLILIVALICSISINLNN